MENFGKFMTVILVMIVTPLINGFVVMKLWNWFIIPIFSLQPLRLIEAIGFTIILTFITTKPSKKNTQEYFWDWLFESVLYTILLGLFTLVFGYIVSLLI
jgi:uncharacterized protein YacL